VVLSLFFDDVNMIDPKQIRYAEAYIPYQKYMNLYPVEEALFRGTIFADLYRPYEIKLKK
jgi:uncharacterized protein (UPF0371 family)